MFILKFGVLQSKLIKKQNKTPTHNNKSFKTHKFARVVISAETPVLQIIDFCFL